MYSNCLKMQTKALTPESYVFRFGKYKNMRAADVAELYELDKNGDDKPVGLLYLKFLVEKCDWFRHKDIIEQIINEISKANLSIKKIEYLPCCICKCNVYNYQLCNSPHVYCSYDCYSILALSYKNSSLDEVVPQERTFGHSPASVKSWVDMKRTLTFENLMTLDENPDNIQCSICDTVHSEKDKWWCEAVEKYERESSWDSL